MNAEYGEEEMTRTEQWVAFLGALQSLSSHKRQLRICFDSYFAKECDWDSIPALFPFVERIGLVVPDIHAAAIYRKTFRDDGWDKVVPVVEGDQFSSYYDLIVTRWW
jgi:hypothetical protein